MKNLKQLEIGQASLAAVYIALGVTLITRPGITGIVICRAAGVLALIFGGVRGASVMREREASWFFQADLVVSVLLLAFGIFALFQPEAVLSILPIALGVYLLMECAVKVQRALALKRFGYAHWWSVLVLGAIAAALGLLLIVNPFPAAETMLMVLGASLVVDGASDLWVLWCLAAHTPAEQ